MRESDLKLTPREKISRAIADLQKTMPFWAYLSLNMRVREVDEQTKGQFKVPMESACVDTLGRFWYNPEFVAKLTLAQTRTLICHEVAHCLTPDAVVGGVDVVFPSVKKRDLVVGSDGKKHRVRDVRARKYSGSIMKIKAMGMLPFSVTPQHRVQVVRMTGWKTVVDGLRKDGRRVKHNEHNERMLSAREWVSAGDLKGNEYLIVPKIKSENKVSTINMLKFAKGNAWSVKCKDFVVDEDLAYLIGAFIANGWTDKNCRSSNIGWLFNKRKKHDAMRIVRTLTGLGYKSQLSLRFTSGDKREEGTWSVHASSFVLKRMLRTEIGTYSHNKIIPKWIESGSDAVVRSCLQGMFACDGWKDDVKIGYCTVNKILALKMQKLLTRFGIFARLLERCGGDEVRIFDKVYSENRCRKQYILNCRDKRMYELLGHTYIKNRPTKMHIDIGDSFAVKISSIERKKYSGKVYNLATNIENYTVNNVLVHNCAFAHPWNFGSRQQQIANIAMDCVVMDIAEGQGFECMPAPVLVNVYRHESTFRVCEQQVTVRDIDKKTYEQIYDELYQQLKDKIVSVPVDVLGPGQSPDEGEGQGASEMPQDVQEAQKRWERALVDAASYAKQQGALPAGMSRLVDGLLKPKVKWSQYLLKSLRPYIMPVDWSYRKPHKKSQLLGIYMPNVEKEQVKVEVIVDTSGSVGGQEMKEFLSEIVGIAQCFPYCEVGVTFVDAKVQNRYVVDNGDIPKILSMVPRGGGGTRMEAGLEQLKEDGTDVPLVVVLTDGCDSYSHKLGDFPFEVVWVISKNGQTRQPYGTIIKMDQ